MARTGFFHHVGTFLLLAATVLLIITCISAPVVNDIGILKVDLGAQSSLDHRNVAFGTFGWCRNNLPDGYVESLIEAYPSDANLYTEMTALHLRSAIVPPRS